MCCNAFRAMRQLINVNVSSKESEAAHKIVHYIIQPINGCDFTNICILYFAWEDQSKKDVLKSS